MYTYSSMYPGVKLCLKRSGDNEGVVKACS